MQPTMCSRCHKNVAVIFITKLEGGETKNEGLCLKCARELGIKPIDDMMKKMGISDEDLDNLTNEMMSAFGGAEGMEGLMAQPNDEDGEEDDGRTATFPFLNQLFGGNGGQRPAQPRRGCQPGGEDRPERQGGAPRQAQVFGKLLHLPHQTGPGGQAGQTHRPGPGAGAGDPDPEPPAEEQPLPHRRARRGQDRHRRGPGP